MAVQRYALWSNGCAKVYALLLYQQRYAPSGETKEICTLLSIQNDMALVIWLLRTPRAAAVAVIDVFSCSLVLFQFCWSLVLHQISLCSGDRCIQCFPGSGPTNFTHNTENPFRKDATHIGTSQFVIVNFFASFPLIPFRLYLWFHNLLFVSRPPSTGSGQLVIFLHSFPRFTKCFLFFTETTQSGSGRLVVIFLQFSGDHFEDVVPAGFPDISFFTFQLSGCPGNWTLSMGIASFQKYCPRFNMMELDELLQCNNNNNNNDTLHGYKADVLTVPHCVTLKQPS